MDDLGANCWKKIQDKAIKEGYREGISEGRHSNFQKSFDEGYKLGIEIGFKLGYYKGYLTGKNIDISSEETLQKITKGNCEICKIENIDNTTISYLTNKQNETNTLLVDSLKSKYSHINI